MESLVSAMIGFLVGAAAGATAWHLMSGGSARGQLERERDEARRALERYRQEVDEHFLQTADSLGQLSQAYRTVHEQLASGARRLCSEEGKRLALARAVEVLPDDEELAESLHAPLDYAPAAKGTLAEDFGLNDTDELARFDAPEVPEEKVGRAPPRDYAEGCEDQGCAPGENGNGRA